MPREKLTKLFNNNVFLLCVFLFFFFVTRIPRIHNDTINPDGVNWHYRTTQFLNGLKYGDLTKTYQHYHPGEMLMWVSAPAVEIVRQLDNPFYTSKNFQMFDTAVKIAVLGYQLFLTLLIIYLLKKIFQFKPALLIVSLFSFEPFFTGNSKLYHMDIMVTLELFIALIFYYLYIKDGTKKYAFFTGLFLALSFLTKSISIILIALILGMEIYRILVLRTKIRYLVIILGVTVLFVFMLLPALWVNPLYYITEIFSEGFRVGVKKGHPQMFFGEMYNDPGFWYYPVAMLMKFSPFILIGFVLGLRYKIIDLFSRKLNIKNIVIKIGNLDFYSLASLFYILYFIAMSFPTKKIDRYLLIMFPWVAVTAYYGFKMCYDKYKNTKLLALVGLMALLFWGVPYVKLFPYYFAYTSPLFGTGNTANKVILQKPFGLGIYDLKNTLLKKYGNEVRIGMYDIKPIESIYANSRVFDVREEEGGSYDVVVLAPYEEIPDDIEDDTFSFEKDISVYINDIEYWRVYVKKFK